MKMKIIIQTEQILALSGLYNGTSSEFLLYKHVVTTTTFGTILLFLDR